MQGKRLSCVDALYHPFLEDGRIRYHTFLCSCCHTNMNGTRRFCRELEPAATEKFDPSYEKELISIVTAKGRPPTTPVVDCKLVLLCKCC